MKKPFLFALPLLALLLLGCRATPDAAAYAPAEADRLTLCTSHKPEVYAPIVREFEERTGIWVTVVSGGTNELLERIADDSLDAPADVMFGGGVESLLNAADRFAPYESPERDAVSEAYRNEDLRITPFSALPIVLIYNTKLIDAGQITGWHALLDPAWRGQIAFANPAVSASNYTALCTLCQVCGGDARSTLTAFAENLAGQQLSGSGEVIAAVADGRLPIGVTLEETAKKYIRADYDIGLVYPVEGTSDVPDGCAILLDAPHRANAERFVDFILGADVQEMLASEMFRRPVREDIALGSDLPSGAILSLISYDYEWSIAQYDAILSAWSDKMERQP